MRALSFLVCLCAAGALAVPAIPRTFTAVLSEFWHTPNGKEGVFNYTQYNVENVITSSIGYLPWTYHGSMQMLFEEGKRTSIDNFFERKNCAVLPMPEQTVSYFTVDEPAVLQGTEPCPTHPQKTCEVWNYTLNTPPMVQQTVFWIIAGTAIPSRKLFLGDMPIANYHMEIRTDFLSFTAATPDPKYTRIPRHQPCADLTKAPEAKRSSSEGMFASARHAFEDPVALPLAKRLVNDPEMIAKAQRSAKGWVAGPSRHYDGLTYEDVSKTLYRPGFGFGVMNEMKVQNTRTAARTAPAVAARGDHHHHIPKSFDAREKWPNCIGAFRDQGSCGSCWAHGTTEALSDRICISKHSHRATNVPLSPQYLLACYAGGSDVCSRGGFGDTTWMNFETMGVVTEECVPYLGEPSECPTTCVDGSPLKKYYVSESYSPYVAFDAEANVKAIQREIMENGPVESGFFVFSDYVSYASGIYQRSADAEYMNGGHIIKIIGWGEENGTDYWIIANSKGPDWGENGTFRVRRGTNECGLEDNVGAGIPDNHHHD